MNEFLLIGEFWRMLTSPAAFLEAERANEAFKRFGEAAQAAGNSIGKFFSMLDACDREITKAGKLRAQMRLKLRGKNWRSAK